MSHRRERKGRRNEVRRLQRLELLREQEQRAVTRAHLEADAYANDREGRPYAEVVAQLWGTAEELQPEPRP